MAIIATHPGTHLTPAGLLRIPLRGKPDGALALVQAALQQLQA